MPFDPDENVRRVKAAAKVTPEERQRRERRRKRLVRSGQALMALGVIVGVAHWIAHLGVLGPQPPGWVDLAAGYPMAAVLLMSGAIVAGQK